MTLGQGYMQKHCPGSCPGQMCHVFRATLEDHLQQIWPGLECPRSVHEPVPAQGMSSIHPVSPPC